MASPDLSTRRGLRDRLPWLYRRGWVLAACVVVALVSATLASRHQPVTYSASATLFVSPGAVGGNPGSANEAQALASTYAGLIPNDAAVLSTVASATGLNSGQVAQATKVNVVNGTSLLTIRFSSGRAGVALRGADSMADSVSGKHPVTKAVPAEAVTVIQHATSATRHHTSQAVIVGLSILLALLLGIVLMIIWERSDARFDRPEQVTDDLGIPARSAGELSDASVLAIMREWRSLAMRRMGAVEGHAPRAALLPATPSAAASVTSLAEMLVVSALNGSMRVSASIADARSEDVAPQNPWGIRSEIIAETAGSRNGQSAELFTPAAIPSIPDLELLVGGQPGAEGGEAVCQQAHVTVLVVPGGSKVREVRRVVSLLTELGSLPVWALMPVGERRQPTRVRYFADDRVQNEVGQLPEHQPS